LRCVLIARMSDKRKKIEESQLQGFKYFKAISAMLESLHEAGCERDIAGNRILHMDQYASLLLLYMFNPICISLRSLQQVSELKKVQKQFGGIKGGGIKGVRYNFYLTFDFIVVIVAGREGQNG
jgi:hypothetical protein